MVDIVLRAVGAATLQPGEAAYMQGLRRRRGAAELTDVWLVGLQ